MCSMGPAVGTARRESGVCVILMHIAMLYSHVNFLDRVLYPRSSCI